MVWLAVLAALWLAPAPAHGEDLTPLIDSVVATYGGPATVARLEAYRIEARVEARMRSLAGTARRDFQTPDRLRVEIRYPDSTEIRILDGDRGWRGDARGLARVEGLPRVAMVYQMLRSAVPWVLVRHRGRLVDLGTRRGGGSEVRRVGLVWSSELDVTYEIDTATRRVTRVEGVLRGPQGQTSFATVYGDFRRVDGLLFAFSEENYASGFHTGDTRVSSVIFAPPDLGPFAPESARP